MSVKVKILALVVVITLSSVVYFSFFTNMQNKRIQQLRNTVDSLENDRERYMEEKYFK